MKSLVCAVFAWDLSVGLCERMSVGLCVRIECGIMCENLLSDDVITKKVSFL